MDAALREEFRAGFYPDRPAAWIDDRAVETDPLTADVAGHLSALAAGERDFAYLWHDAVVYRLLERLVPERAPGRGAVIGCATGCFPAMQIATGVLSCSPHRRPSLLADLRLVGRASDRLWWGRARRAVGNLIGRIGSSSQPMFVLEKSL